MGPSQTSYSELIPHRKCKVYVVNDQMRKFRIFSSAKAIVTIQFDDFNRQIKNLTILTIRKMVSTFPKLYSTLWHEFYLNKR